MAKDPVSPSLEENGTSSAIVPSRCLDNDGPSPRLKLRRKSASDSSSVVLPAVLSRHPYLGSHWTIGAVPKALSLDMNDCPVELWARIASLACTDGGPTGRSLSLVSRAMHRVVEPIRYHSVSLIGKQRLFSFEERLAALDKPPDVRHLFIANLAKHGYSLEDMQADDFTDELWEEWEEREQKSIAKIDNALRKVVVSTAQTLCTLSILGCAYDHALKDLTFPRLRDLVLPGVPSGGVPDAHTRYPSLRRLHAMSAGDRSREIFLRLANVAPYATHLRLSNVSQDLHLPLFLRILLDVPPRQRAPGVSYVMGVDDAYPPNLRGAQDALAIAKQLSSLECIYLQLTDQGLDGDCAYGMEIDAIMTCGLCSIRDAAERGEAVGQFIWMSQKRYTFEDAHKDWLDLVEGGDGPWPEGGQSSSEYRSASVRARWPQEDTKYFSQ